MNEKHYHYEAPAAQVLVVYFENRILDASISAERKSYGTANVDNWD